MGTNIYDAAAKGGIELSEKIIKNRSAILNELEKLGDAFVSVVKAKLSVNNIARDVTTSPFSANTVVLRLFLAGQQIPPLATIMCTFDPADAYPCVFSNGERSVICSTIKEVRSELLSFCPSISTSISSAIIKQKEQTGLPMKNPHMEDSDSAAPSRNESDDGSAR